MYVYHIVLYLGETFKKIKQKLFPFISEHILYVHSHISL